jgi:diguanylate cyclase (GGDEF)-like protein
VALAAPGGAVAVAWLAYRQHTAPRDGRLPTWLELGLFLVGMALAMLLPRWRRPSADAPSPSDGPPSAPDTSSPPAADGPELSPLPQGARSLLAILARALGEGEVALFVRQGGRLCCRAQEPKAFGAQGLGHRLLGLMPQAKSHGTMQVVALDSRFGGRAERPRRIAVPLYPDKDQAHASHHPTAPWAVLFAQRRTGPFGEADQALVCSVAEQIAVSLQLEQALRTAQADRLRLEHMATTDSLTELANRRHFMRIFALQLERAKRYKRRLSLIFLDIDHFKQVNDTYGHATGDEVLKGVARVLRQTARKTDTVARYGGEEFAILMEETGLSGAQRIAERIQEALKKQPFGPQDALFFKTVSVGVATFPQHGDAPERLIACADEALYQAKRNGRDQITLYRGPVTACSSEPR